jgi:hypothetical protein
MKTTIKTILIAKPAIEKLLATDVPLSAAFSLRRLLRAVESELKHFLPEQQIIAKKYGRPDGKGGFAVDPKSAGWDRFNEEMDALASNCHVTLDFDPISPEELGPRVMLSARDVDHLDEFIKMKPTLVDKPKAARRRA